MFIQKAWLRVIERFPTLGLRSVQFALAVSLIAGVLLCLSRLTGVYGAESALGLGVVLPLVACPVAARAALSTRAKEPNAPLSTYLRAGTWLALAMVTIPVLVLTVNQFWIRNCTPLEGLAFIALGPGIGTWFASLVGVFLGARLAPRLATALAILLPWALVFAGLYEFLSTPAVYVFSHFAGWFPGTIYDQGITIPARYLSFRALTLSFMAGTTCLLAAADGGISIKEQWTRARTRPLVAVAGIVLLGAGFSGSVFGKELGHRTSSAHIAEELGLSVEGRRCTVHVPRELDRREVERLSLDCDFRIEQAEQRIGVSQRDRVHAFFFRSPDEKQWHMGAARTMIAKPWRSEVYLQSRTFPHSVLAHEITHVVAGNTAQGPFRVGGQLSGLLPDPALIEGTAVGVAWDQRGGLTPHQWAKAMRELDLLPPLDQVVGLSFLGQPASNAYTIAGSFIRYLLDAYGAEPLRNAYRDGSIADAFGKPLSELEDEWLSHLDTIVLPAEALELANLRFSRPGIFSATCPHEVARLRTRLGQDLAAGDDRAAQETCAELRNIDPFDPHTGATDAGISARLGDFQLAERIIRELSSFAAPEPLIASAREQVADATWRNGDEQEAAREYRSLLRLTQDESKARQLEVKLLGAEAAHPEVAEAVFDLLVGRRGSAASTAFAVHLAREVSVLRPDGLGQYLEARQLMFALESEPALRLLEVSRERGLPTHRLQVESTRMLGQLLYLTGDIPGAQQHYRMTRADETRSETDRAVAQDWLERIRWEGARGPTPRGR